jgi:hypothetical protein
MRRLTITVVLAAAAVLLAGCGIGASTVPIPTAVPSPSQVVSAGANATAGQVTAAVRAAGIVAEPANVPYRPAESPLLTAAPRTVLRAILPGDDAHGFIVIYDFPDAAAAYAAGTEMAHYLASGPGRIQFPNDAKHVIRQVGSTIVFYTWSPANSPEAEATTVATALETLGLEIPIVR